MSSDEPNINMKDTKIEEPIFGLSVIQNMPTLAADFVKVMTEYQTQSCTMQFFRTHPVPKHSQTGMLIEGIQNEAFLEVKIPLSSLIGMSLYMNEIWKKVRQQKHTGFSYGPSAISLS